MGDRRHQFSALAYTLLDFFATISKFSSLIRSHEALEFSQNECSRAVIEKGIIDIGEILPPI